MMNNKTTCFVETKFVFSNNTQSMDFYAISATASPAIKKYASSRFVSSARYNDDKETYQYERACNLISVGGLHRAIKQRFHPTFNPYPGKKKRKYRQYYPSKPYTGSSKKIGSQVDAEILQTTKVSNL